MKNNTPLLSVVVPVYNTEQYLPQCLDSIINQTLNKIKIIVVNDGSPGNCEAICSSYPQVTHLSYGENRGLFLAREFGVRHASGEYILHVDSDDIIAPELCQKIHDTILSDHPDCITYDLATHKDNTTTPSTLHNNNFQNIDRSHLFFENILDETIFGGAFYQKIFRRDIIIKVLDELNVHEHIITAEDYLFNITCSYHTTTVRHLDYLGYTYNLDSEDSATRSASTLNSALKYLQNTSTIMHYLNKFSQLHSIPFEKFTITKKIFIKWFFIIHSSVCQNHMTELLPLFEQFDPSDKQFPIAYLFEEATKSLISTTHLG